MIPNNKKKIVNKKKINRGEGAAFFAKACAVWYNELNQYHGVKRLMV